MGRLLSRVRKLEAQAGRTVPQVHAVIWKVGRETEEQAKERYMAESPANEIIDGDLLVFVREQPGCPELKRRGKGRSP